jgi:hypothetical protein
LKKGGKEMNTKKLFGNLGIIILGIIITSVIDSLIGVNFRSMGVGPVSVQHLRLHKGLAEKTG